MPLEIERKYLGADLEEIKKRLIDLGATSDGARFEFNIVFDTSPSILKQKKLLRLRIRASRDGSTSVLTWKEPARETPSDNFKRRLEFETLVADPENMVEILGRLGCFPKAVYEKTRESYIFQWRDADGKTIRVATELDETPIGNVIELEGDPEAIEKAEISLDLRSLRKSDKSYHDLNQEWREKRGLPPSIDIIFPQEIRMDIAERLGINADDLPGLEKLARTSRVVHRER